MDVQTLTPKVIDPIYKAQAEQRKLNEQIEEKTKKIKTTLKVNISVPTFIKLKQYCEKNNMKIGGCIEQLIIKNCQL